MTDLLWMNKLPGAGIIIVKHFPTGYKVLGLFDQRKGKFDLPKGTIDKGESAFQAALRETQEECGIINLNFKWGKDPINISRLTFFLAETTAEPSIVRNPHSGVLEHLFAEWMTWEALENEIIEYLIPALTQAKTIIKNSGI